MTAGAALAPQTADAAIGFWFRTKSPNALPIAVSIPAYYGSAVSTDDQFNGPPPAFSLGPNGSALPLDQSLVAQGGTGILTDDLLLQAAGKLGVTVGDSAGFGAVNGELMMVDELAFMRRASGPVRKLYWVQTLGALSVTQTIILTVDLTQGRIWNKALRAATTGTGALTDHQQNFTQADFPLITGIPIPPGGVPGLDGFIGCPDSYLIAGLKPAFSGPPGNQTLHPDLQTYFTLQQGIGEQNPGGGRDYIPKISTKAAPSTWTTFDGFYWGGAKLSINHANIQLTNGALDGSGWAIYQQATGINFTLLNCRLGDNGDTDRTHLYIDNMAQLLAFQTACQGVNVAPNSQTAAMDIIGRQIIPSAPGTQVDGNYNPFLVQTASSYTAPTIVSIGTNTSGTKYIQLNFAVPGAGQNPTNGLPAGLNCLLNPGGNSMPGGDRTSNGGLLNISAGVVASIQDFTFDGTVPGYKYGMAGCNFIPIAGSGGFGPADDGTGTFRGLARCNFKSSPQDSSDISYGAINRCVFVPAANNNGSHVDIVQTTGVPNVANGGFSITGSYLDNRKRYYDASMFVDGEANPWFALYGTNKLSIGGNNAGLYAELCNQNTGGANYGGFFASGNIVRGGTYSHEITAGNNPPAIFAQSSPASVALKAQSNPINLSTQPFPGMVIGQTIAFNPGTLPPAITAHTLYKIAGYSLFFVTIGTNTTSGFAVGDLLTLSGGTLMPGGGQATFRVTQIDGGATSGPGKVTAIVPVNPGQYTVRPTSLAAAAVAPSTGANFLTVSAAYPSFVLSDLAGNLIDTSASSTGTGYGNSSNGAIIGTTNTFKQISTGLTSIHDNYVSEQFSNSAIYLQGATSDAQGNPRSQLDAVSIYNIRWLFGAPSDAVADPVGGAPFAYISALSNNPTIGTSGKYITAFNAPVNSLMNFSAVATATNKVRVTFTQDPNARVSLDGGLANPSGYRYRLTPTSTGSSGPWKAAPAYPATIDSTHSYIDVTDSAFAPSAGFLIEFEPVNCYSSPDMNPLQFPANANSASVVMPAA